MRPLEEVVQEAAPFYMDRGKDCPKESCYACPGKFFNHQHQANVPSARTSGQPEAAIIRLKRRSEQRLQWFYVACYFI
jgi:hypothetical protein